MRRQLDVIPQLEKKLEEQQRLMDKSNKNFILLSKAVQDIRDSRALEAKVRLAELRWCCETCNDLFCQTASKKLSTSPIVVRFFFFN